MHKKALRVLSLVLAILIALSSLQLTMLGTTVQAAVDGNAVITFKNTKDNLLDLLAAAGYDSTSTTQAESLKTITIKANAGVKKVLANADFNDSKTVGKSFSNFINLTSVIIEKPASDVDLTWNGNKIPNNAFKGLTNLKQVKIGIDTSYIGTSAFEGCISLETAEFGLTRTLGPWAFKGDTSLKSITFNKTYLPIGLDDVVGPPPAPGDWFNGVDTDNLIIYVPTDGIDAFLSDDYWGNIGTIMSNGDNTPRDADVGAPATQNVIINTFTTKQLKTAIDNSNFKGTDYGDIKVLTINDGILDPSDCTFIATSLKKLEELYIVGNANFLNGTIPKNAFEGNRFLRIVKADNVTVIGVKAFNLFESLTEVNFPNVTTISSQAFAQTKGSSSSKLTTARFPKVQVIEQRAFYFCVNLTDLYLGKNPPKLTVPEGKQGLWFNFVTNMTIHVPSLAVYNEYIKLENSDQIDWSAMTFVADNGDKLPVIPPAAPYIDSDYDFLRVDHKVPYYDGDYKLSLNMYTFNMNLNSWLQGRTSPVPMKTLDAIKWAHDNGFDAVDVTCYYIPGYSNTDMPTPAQQVDILAYAKQIKDYAGSLGIVISGTGIQNNFADPNQARRAVDIERIKFWTKVASEMGAPVIRIFSGPPPVDITRTGWATITRDRIAPAIQEVADYANTNYPTVQIGIQNHGDMLATANQVLQLLKWVDRTNVGVVNDTGYYRDFMSTDASNYDWYKDISLILPYSTNFQVKKKPGGAETTELMDLNKLFGIIRNSPYRGYIPVELLWLPNDDGYPGKLNTPPYDETLTFLQMMRTAMNNTKHLASVGVSDLTGISLSTGALNETFDASKTSYTHYVANNVTSSTLTPMVAYTSASVKVNGTTVASGQPSAAIPLNVGVNPITVTVTAGDGSKKTYTVNVIRMSNNALLSNITADQGTLSPAFSPTVPNYTLDVPNTISSVNLFLTRAEPNEKLSVTGAVYSTVTGNVYSYKASDLKVGSNPIQISVTAQDGSTNPYYINVNKAPSNNADLNSLTMSNVTLSPAFASGTTTYNSSVANAISSLTVTASVYDSSAKLAVNGNSVVSGQASSPINLNVGNNTITIVVTAQNGTTKTYTVTVYRAGHSSGSSSRGGGGTVPAPPSTDGNSKPTDPTKENPKTEQPKTEPSTGTKPAVQFSDTAGHWAEANIKQAVSKGIVSGYPDGSFKPGYTVTRAEFAVMLMNTLKPQGDGATLNFADTAKIGGWAQKAVAQALQAGIISGYEDGSFRPDAEITRAEMAVMLAKALGLAIEAGKATDFADDKDVPAWAKGAVEAMKKQSLIEGKGDNEFSPTASTTRAEAITVLLKVLNQKSK